MRRLPTGGERLKTILICAMYFVPTAYLWAKMLAMIFVVFGVTQ